MKKHYNVSEIRMNTPVKNTEYLGSTLHEVLKERNILEECIAEAEKEIFSRPNKNGYAKKKNIKKNN